MLKDRWKLAHVSSLTERERREREDKKTSKKHYKATEGNNNRGD